MNESNGDSLCAKRGPAYTTLSTPSYARSIRPEERDQRCIRESDARMMTIAQVRTEGAYTFHVLVSHLCRGYCWMACFEVIERCEKNDRNKSVKGSRQKSVGL